MRRLLPIVTLLVAAPAAAFDSYCHFADGDCEGPSAARTPWVDGPLGPAEGRHGDEHRRIFERARVLGGLPDALAEPFTLTVFTGDGTVALDADGEVEAPTLRPVPFAEAQRRRERRLTIAELAQLPDFSFGLWDWADGNESCPIDAHADPISCHALASHMGPVNSNHFLPQAQGFYAYYHELALARADACADMAERLDGAEGRFRAFVLDCERQALALEAVAQHYLQDAWSSGHMWHRWGSPDPSSFRTRTDAVLVALVAGMIHGSEAKLGISDALCSPADGVGWSEPADAPGAWHSALGDRYAHELTSRPDSPWLTQHGRLYACAVHSLREVYGRTATEHGAMADPGGLLRPDPFDASCFGQRATNRSMWLASGLGASPQRMTFGAMFSHYWLLDDLIFGAGWYFGDHPPGRDDMQRLEADLLAYEMYAAVMADLRPDGTEVARQPGSLLGVGPNHEYADRTPLAPYVDPPLPWPRTPVDGAGDVDDPRNRARTLARTFHRAHAADLCTWLTAGDLDAMKAAVENATGHDQRDAACAVCGEIVGRHVRVGAGPDEYDAALEPLCHHLAGEAAPFVYQQATGGLDAATLGREWCGCPTGRVGALALNDRNHLWAVDPATTPPVAVSPCDMAGAPLSVDLGAAVPEGAVRLPGELPGVLVRFAPGPVLGWVDTVACQERDLDADESTTTPGAPAGVTRFTHPEGRHVRGAGAFVTADGRRVAVITAVNPADECDTRLEVLDLDRFRVVGGQALGAYATEVQVVPSAPGVGEGPVALVSLTGTPACFRGEVQAFPLAALLAAGPDGVEPHRFIFAGGGTHAPRRMAWVAGTRFAAVVLGGDDGHLGVMDLVTGGARVLGDEGDLDDFWLHLTDVAGYRDGPTGIRWILAQGESHGFFPNGGCLDDGGFCAALRTVRFDWSDGSWEEGVEWVGPQARNVTLEIVPGSPRFLVAHDRVGVSQLTLLGGIHAFGYLDEVSGPGGTGVLFPYP